MVILTCILHGHTLTFEQWADFPDGQWGEGGELAIRHLHEEQRYATQHQE